MRRPTRLFSILAVTALVAVAPVRAQEVAMEATFPDTIVVTATRQAADVRETGRRVTVWTAQDLARLPVTSFDELLRTVGGVEVQSRGGFGVQSDLTMRGASFNGVLVLLDGARLNDPMTGHFAADFPIPLSEIARIEVLRGPASALYGPDALGGVVQVFTYAGLEAAALPVRATEATGLVQRGAFDLTRLDAAARFGTGAARYGLAAAWARSDGMTIEDAAGRPVVGSDGAVRTDFERAAATASFAHAFGGAALYARAGLDDRSFGAYHFYTGFASDTAREATSTYWAQVRLQNASAPERWQVQLAAKQHEDTYVYNPVTPANRHTSRLLTAHAQVARMPAAGLTFTGGLAASYRAIDSNSLGTHDDVSAGVFGFARYQLLPRLTLNGGSRLDCDPGYGVEVTPQLSAAYNAPRLTLRAAAGRAVREPNYVERYFNTVRPQPNGNLGNPDLKAERAWSYEAGLDLYPAAGFSLHATVFQRDTENMIDYTHRTGIDTVWLARNLLDVRTRGLELDAAWLRYFGDGRLRLEGTYTWLDPEIGAVEPGIEHKYVLTHARQLFQAVATLDAGPIQIGLQHLWKERLTEANYHVVDVRLAYAWAFGRQRLVLSGEIRNLFDTAYSEIFDAPMPGRWWIAGLRISR